MTKGITVMDRRDLIRVLQAQLHRELRDDINVHIRFLVTFEVDDETYVNTVVDPYQELPRWKSKQLVDEAISRLNSMDSEANTPQSGDLPVSLENIEQALVTSG